MTDLAVVRLEVPERQHAMAKALRSLADQAERGELLEVVVVYRTADNQSGSYQSHTASRTQMAGALLNAAVRRLGYVEGE